VFLVSVIDLDVCYCMWFARGGLLFCNVLLIISPHTLTLHSSLNVLCGGANTKQANSSKPSPTQHLLNHHWKLRLMKWWIMRIN
jgi:hypothetical protein